MLFLIVKSAPQNLISIKSYDSPNFVHLFTILENYLF